MSLYKAVSIPFSECVHGNKVIQGLWNELKAISKVVPLTFLAMPDSMEKNFYKALRQLGLRSITANTAKSKVKEQHVVVRWYKQDALVGITLYYPRLNAMFLEWKEEERKIFSSSFFYTNKEFTDELWSLPNIQAWGNFVLENGKVNNEQQILEFAGQWFKGNGERYEYAVTSGVIKGNTNENEMLQSRISYMNACKDVTGFEADPTQGGLNVKLMQSSMEALGAVEKETGEKIPVFIELKSVQTVGKAYLLENPFVEAAKEAAVNDSGG